MASFQKLAVWPVGYFRAFSSWVLRNRRNISARIAAIDAEVARIGFITVYYASTTEDGKNTLTDQRVGFGVTKGSSLERLCRAYVAQGGNPFDISSFMYPDSTEVLEADSRGNATQSVQRYPHGGVIAPKSVEYNDPLPKEGENSGFGEYQGGYLNTDRYYAPRMGGRMSRGAFDSNTVVRYMHSIRRWASQDIKERVQDIEWRIIKLCDLREQLVKERDEMLVSAFGGALTGVAEFNEKRFLRDLQVQNLVQDMYERLYETESDGTVRSFNATSPVAFLHFTFEDEPSEIRDPLGG